MRFSVALASIAAVVAAIGLAGCAGCSDPAAGEGDAGVDGDGGSTCDGGLLDPVANLCWQNPRAVAGYAFQDAIDYCGDLTLGARADWVLPRRDDFVGLLGGCDDDVMDWENGYCDPCAESATCGALFGADTGWYWSSTLYDMNHAWVAHFGDGYLNRSEIGFDLYVRCVRPGP